MVLPLPVLDGGHLVFLAAEAVEGKPVSRLFRMLRTELVVTLLVLTAFALFNDFLRL